MLSPHPKIRPGIIGVPLDAKTDGEITLLACLITLTPGTLSLDVSDDRKTLYVHSMYGPSRDETLDGLRDMERRLLRMTRGTGGRS